MRISLIEPKENLHLVGRARAFLDGVRVECCVCADDVEGIVIVRLESDPEYHHAAGPYPPGITMSYKTRYGKVQILFDVEECPGGWYGRSTPEAKYPDVHIPRQRTPEQIALEQDEHGIPFYEAYPREELWKK